MEKTECFYYNLTIKIKGDNNSDWEEIEDDLRDDLNCVLTQNFNLCKTSTGRNHNCELINVEVI